MLLLMKGQPKLSKLYPNDVLVDTLASMINCDFMAYSTTQHPKIGLFYEALDSKCVRRVDYGCDNGQGTIYVNSLGRVHVCNGCDELKFGMNAFSDVTTALEALAAFEARWPPEEDHSMIDYITGIREHGNQLESEWDEFLQSYSGGKFCEGFYVISEPDVFDFDGDDGCTDSDYDYSDESDA